MALLGVVTVSPLVAHPQSEIPAVGRAESSCEGAVAARGGT